MHSGSKNSIHYNGYRNGICIDVEHGIIRYHAVCPANVHNSHRLPCLLDLKILHNYTLADSLYYDECSGQLLIFCGFECLICEMRTRDHRISDAADELLVSI